MDSVRVQSAQRSSSPVPDCGGMELDEETLRQIIEGTLSPTLSQTSSYSDLDDGISEVILQVEVPTKINPSPTSVSLGKRKAEDSPPQPLRKADSWVMVDSDPLLSPDVESCSKSYSAPEIIAHSPRWQPYFDKYLSYGVQYEIARLVTLGCFDYSDLSTDILGQLVGSNADAAPKTVEALAGIFDPEKRNIAFAQELISPRQSPWNELDIEANILSNNKFAGLGFSPEHPDWYGGKVEFQAKLRDLSSTDVPNYKVILEKPVLGKSCRFTRRFGSQSFLRIKIPAPLLNNTENELVRFLCRPFIMTGNVFRAFYAKRDHVFLFKTCEVFEGLAVSEPATATQGSNFNLKGFLNWHNPLHFNMHQNMTKWAARFALGLSNTVPGLRLVPSDVLKECDIVSTAGSDMTDGCGYINKAGLLKLHTHFQWKSFPTAVQCRLGGAKGVFSLHNNTENTTELNPTVWIRPSQLKIKHPFREEPDPALFIVDVVQAARMKGGRLKAETLINLAENGVPHEVLVKLLQEGLDEHVAGFVRWDGPDAMLDLWCYLAHQGGVMAARRAREASGEARARGYSYLHNEDEGEGEDEDELQESADMQERLLKWWSDELSGNPSSLEEAIMILLDAGFKPQNCVALREKLFKVVTKHISDYVLHFSIDVPMSCTAMLIPDPFGVLKPGEVHIKSSKKNLKWTTTSGVDVITGEVLLTRYPCKLPSDIQKFLAVEKMELRKFLDVIVCSIQGDRRQADLLAGGDYDGDTGLAIWQPEIVDSFIPADLKHSLEPAGVAECFSEANEKVTAFLERLALDPPMTEILALQEVLLGDLRDPSIIGQYSGYHDSAIYELGYDHPQTVRLAYMFCKVLDGSKTGLTVRPDVFHKDKKIWQGRNLYWKMPAEEKSKLSEAEVDKLCHRRGLPPFIMDTISKEAQKAGRRKREEVEKLFSVWDQAPFDNCLAEPWLKACNLAERYRAEEKCDRRCRDLKQIMDHVHSVFAKYHGTDGREEKGASPSRDEIRQLSRQFSSKPTVEDVLMDKRDIRRLRASYAYFYDAKAENGWSFFPWDMAIRELCFIKAYTSGAPKTVTMQFYEHFATRKDRRYRG